MYHGSKALKVTGSIRVVRLICINKTRYSIKPLHQANVRKRLIYKWVTIKKKSLKIKHNIDIKTYKSFNFGMLIKVLLSIDRILLEYRYLKWENKRALLKQNACRSTHLSLTNTEFFDD